MDLGSSSHSPWAISKEWNFEEFPCFDDADQLSPMAEELCIWGQLIDGERPREASLKDDGCQLENTHFLGNDHDRLENHDCMGNIDVIHSEPRLHHGLSQVVLNVSLDA